MGTEFVGAISSPNSSVFATPPFATAGKSSRKVPGVNPSGHEKGWNVDPSHSNFIELQKINDRLNLTAKIQRTYEKRFERVNDYIERMKIQLERIMKQFPPFPPGSEDRVQALRSYAYFRKLIDQLTIPPPDDPANKGISDLAVSSSSAAEEIQVFHFRADISIQDPEIQISS
jgi:hypothetical protein